MCVHGENGFPLWYSRTVYQHHEYKYFESRKRWASSTCWMLWASPLVALGTVSFSEFYRKLLIRVGLVGFFLHKMVQKVVYFALYLCSCSKLKAKAVPMSLETICSGAAARQGETQCFSSSQMQFSLVAVICWWELRSHRALVGALLESSAQLWAVSELIFINQLLLIIYFILSHEKIFVICGPCRIT